MKVTPIPTDHKHPAAGQFGLFAAQTLAPGEHVMDYLGLVMMYEHCNAGTGWLLPPGSKVLPPVKLRALHTVNHTQFSLHETNHDHASLIKHHRRADSEYVACLAPGLMCDAERHGNEARFINDFHGTGKNPNVRFERRVDEDSGEHRLVSQSNS